MHFLVVGVVHQGHILYMYVYMYLVCSRYTLKVPPQRQQEGTVRYLYFRECHSQRQESKPDSFRPDSELYADTTTRSGSVCLNDWWNVQKPEICLQ